MTSVVRFRESLNSNRQVPDIESGQAMVSETDRKVPGDSTGSDLRGDYTSIVILLLLYTLQGQYHFVSRLRLKGHDGVYSWMHVVSTLSRKTTTGVPMGLASSIPLLLQERGAS